nr:hypothetical protein [Microcoleus sp. FACHB-672]
MLIGIVQSNAITRQMQTIASRGISVKIPARRLNRARPQSCLHEMNGAAFIHCVGCVRVPEPMGETFPSIPGCLPAAETICAKGQCGDGLPSETKTPASRLPCLSALGVIS